MTCSDERAALAINTPVQALLFLDFVRVNPLRRRFVSRAPQKPLNKKLRKMKRKNKTKKKQNLILYLLLFSLNSRVGKKSIYEKYWIVMFFGERAATICVCVISMSVILGFSMRLLENKSWKRLKAAWIKRIECYLYLCHLQKQPNPAQINTNFLISKSFPIIFLI